MGHIDVEDATIHGIVRGIIPARRVRLGPASKVIAEITHDILSIDEAASFEGQCRRIPIGPRMPSTRYSARELADRRTE